MLDRLRIVVVLLAVVTAATRLSAQAAADPAATYTPLPPPASAAAKDGGLVAVGGAGKQVTIDGKPYRLKPLQIAYSQGKGMVLRTFTFQTIATSRGKDGMAAFGGNRITEATIAEADEDMTAKLVDAGMKLGVIGVRRPLCDGNIVLMDVGYSDGVVGLYHDGVFHWSAGEAPAPAYIGYRVILSAKGVVAGKTFDELRQSAAASDPGLHQIIPSPLGDQIATAAVGAGRAPYRYALAHQGKVLDLVLREKRDKIVVVTDGNDQVVCGFDVSVVPAVLLFRVEKAAMGPVPADLLGTPAYALRAEGTTAFMHALNRVIGVTRVPK